MSVAISASRKRGRPHVGSLNIGVRVPPDQVAVLDAWIAAQPEPKPSRPEAMRQLMELGIKASAPMSDASIGRDEMASDSASKPSRPDNALPPVRPTEERPPPSANPDPDNPLSHRPRGPGDP